ncbi:MAG TPA: hypothetical protein VFK89_02135, partial [Actinomycetota bacterium]|nr:hypothetical protein [Actinomycetota bacterium]
MTPLPRRALVAGALVLSLALPAASALGAPPESSGVSSFIVVTRPGVDPAGVSRDWSRSFSARVSFVYTHALSGFAATLPDALVAR